MRPRATRGDAGEAGDSTSRGHEPPCGAVVCAMAARGRTLMSRGRLNLLVASGASRLAGWRTGPLAQQRVQQRDRVVQLGGAVAGDVPQRHVEQRVGRAWVARRGQTRPQLSHHVVTARARAHPGRVRAAFVGGESPPEAACGLRLRGKRRAQRAERHWATPPTRVGRAGRHGQVEGEAEHRRRHARRVELHKLCSARRGTRGMSA